MRALGTVRCLSRAGVSIVVLSAAGCAAEASDARAEIEAVTRRWEAALVAGSPSAAVPEVFTEDAARLPAGEPPVRGRPAIAAALAGSQPVEAARFTIDEIEVDGSLAYATGTYDVRAAAGLTLTGKFLEVWRRTADGWRIHRVMWD